MRIPPVLALFAALPFFVPACSQNSEDAAITADTARERAELAMSPDQPAVIEVTARNHVEFDLSADRVPSGWTTLRLRNETQVIHFGFLVRLPEGKTVEDYKREITPLFQNLMDQATGRPLTAPTIGTELPAWYPDMLFMGGPGLLGPGRSGEVTVKLQPGVYAIECYIKAPDGRLHSFLGMVEQIVVTTDESPAREPEADITMTLSTDGGIEVDAPMRSGPQTIAVRFADQKVYENFAGHDAHLVRLNDEAPVDDLVAWIGSQTGLEEAAPAEFLGGTHDMPAGSTAYLTVQLEPGSYAWIAEVPNAEERGMVKRFTVPAESVAAP
jgi:hypothetical protein